MKDNQQTAERILVILCTILFIALWPTIKWLAGILLLAALILFIKALIDSKQVKKEIAKDPKKHYDSIKKDMENKND